MGIHSFIFLYSEITSQAIAADEFLFIICVLKLRKLCVTLHIIRFSQASSLKRI